MTEKELEEAIHLRDDLKAIEISLKHPKSTYVAAFYKDYNSGVGVPRVEAGEDGGRGERELLELKYDQKKKALQKAVIRIQRFIDKIEDSDIRSILQLYYIGGMSQQEIAQLKHRDQSTVSRQIDKFWNEKKEEK